MKDEFLKYKSPLAERNASEEMQKLFSPQMKFSTWRRLWLALAEAEKELGLDISDEAIEQMRANIENIDFEKAQRYEQELRHDVMAHIHTFGDAAPAARGIIHLGATSCFVTDNTDLIIMREALKLICINLANIIDKLGKFAYKYKDLATLGFTHFQPAQLTTVGKRATLWCYDFIRDLEYIESCKENLPFRSIKGTTGTQASFLALFNGDEKKVVRLEKLIARKMGFKKILPVCGQTYSRKIDSEIIFGLSNLAASAHKLANDIRLLAGLKEIEEPFEKKQVGSSAMAYKRNPMRCERTTGLARFLIGLASIALQTHAEQWLERTLDDSSTRRIIIPEAFLAADGILNLLLNIVDGLVVNERVIQKHIEEELPFMATEEILMAAVKAGEDRQSVHERIRKHSLKAAEQVKKYGQPNDLISRLKKDKLFEKIDIDKILEPQRFVGRAPSQVDEFIEIYVEPIRRRYKKYLGKKGYVKV